MATLVHKWSVDPRQFLTTVNDSVARKTEELAEKIFDGVVDRSPVSSGGFRASWSAMKGSPTFQYVIGGSPGNPLPRPSYPKIRVKAGEAIHITNGSPQGGRLENGHSSQAPNGMVALTLASL